jgi:hypothetical protein
METLTDTHIPVEHSRVLDLNWHDFSDGHLATSHIGHFIINKQSGKFVTQMRIFYGNRNTTETFDSIEEAKKSCDSYHRLVINSYLKPISDQNLYIYLEKDVPNDKGLPLEYKVMNRDSDKNVTLYINHLLEVSGDTVLVQNSGTKVISFGKAWLDVNVNLRLINIHDQLQSEFFIS